MFDDLIALASEAYRVPESWIRAVIETESAWDPNAYRAEPAIKDASYGLMQLLYGTARGLGFTGQPEALYAPELNIDLGAQLLGQLRAKYGDDFRRVYSAYNSGSPDKWTTSPQVAKNVARAVENLERWVRAGLEKVVAVTPDAAPAFVGLLVLVLMWAWAGSGKRR